MKKDIKKLVEELQIPYLKKRLEDTQQAIFYLQREISSLTLDHRVGGYAHRLDEMFDIIQELELSKDAEKNSLLKQKLFLLDYKNKSIESDKKIQKYLSLRNQYCYLLSQNHDYYKTIQIDFKHALLDMDIPNIYVYQGETKVPKHIISGELKEHDALIYPFYHLESNRDFRHFYNQVHFRYLESITESYSFDLDKNDLGKIKIK